MDLQEIADLSTLTVSVRLVFSQSSRSYITVKTAENIEPNHPKLGQ